MNLGNPLTLTPTSPLYPPTLQDVGAARILYEGGAPAIADWTAKTNDAGFAAEQATTLVNVGFHSLEDLLQVEESDLAAIPEIGAQAGAIIEAARIEQARRASAVSAT